MSEFEKYMNLMFIKTILYIVSILGCGLFILLYIYLFFHVIRNKSEKISSKNVGLGTNYMLMLIISNIGGALTEIILYYKVKEIKDNVPKSFCYSFGFFRNYFELSSVSWISMITFLFYKSTTPTNIDPNEECYQFLIGILYSFILPLLFTLPPYFSEIFEALGPKCSFSKSVSLYAVLFTIHLYLNVILQILALYRSYFFYNQKLKILKEQNIEEYNLLNIYVWIFLLFPIYLILTRTIKLISRLNEEVFLVIGECSFALSGFVDSFVCIFFLRGAIPCCKKEENVLIEEKSISSINIS